jgi:thymidylate synthase
MKPYDDALRHILEHGVRKPNRTGVDTLSIFGHQTRYRIDECFPLLTGRKVWPKAIFAELLWILSGSTNNNDLEALGSKIWKLWVSEEFEKKHGLPQGDLGPVYGFQLRHFGADYKYVRRLEKEISDLQRDYDAQTEDENKFKPWEEPSWDHTCSLPSSSTAWWIEKRMRVLNEVGGVDQLTRMVNMLKEDPNSRRNLWSLWNPADEAMMRLPPCHYSFQVWANDGKLSGMLTMRSNDFPIGHNANATFYSALLYMLAQQCNMQPYELIISTADTHIYIDQIDAIKQYLEAPKPDSPKLHLKKAPDIFSYSMDDFEVVDYNPGPSIKIPVAV